MKKYFVRLEQHPYDSFKHFIRPLHELPLKNNDTNIIEVDKSHFPDRGTIQIYHKRVDAGRWEVSPGLRDMIESGVEYLIVEFDEGNLKPTNLNSESDFDAEDPAPNDISLVRQAINGDKIHFIRLSDDQFYEIINVNISFDELLACKCINCSRRPINKRILLSLKDGVYGPFQASFFPDAAKIELGAVEKNKSVKKYDAAEIERLTSRISFVDKINFDSRSFVYSSYCLPEHKEIYDFISDEQLKVLFNSYLNKHKNTYTKAQLKELKDILSITSEDDYNFQKRKDRILGMINHLDTNSDLMIGLMNSIVDIRDGADSLDKFVRMVLDNHWSVIEARLEKDEKYSNLIASRRNELEKIQNDIDSKREELESIDVEQTKQKIRDEALRESGQLYKEIEHKKSQLTELCDKINNHKNEAGVRMEYDRVKQELKMLSADRDAVFRQISEGFEKALVEGQLSATLLAEAFSSVKKSKKEEQSIKEFTPHPLNCISDFSANDVIMALHKNLAMRNFTKEDVVNILICLSQGFITVFAGDPGTGKSSLCSIIAKSLGLSHPDSSRFIEISVERGWSSRKDFVGYYNPLVGALEYPNESLLNALHEMNANENTYLPWLVLLDEANLSPIEHYWADFMRIADFDEHRKREINLGNKYVFKIRDNMRFLATINFDHTTELLSPRFLNRAWVIMLDSASISTFDFDGDDVENAESVFNYDILRRYFSEPSDDFVFDNTSEISDLWKRIKTAYAELQISIPPRCEKLLRQYCGAASKFMPETQALDFAFAQKILPSTYGYGSKYRQLIENLRKITINTMPKSNGVLGRILENGEDNMEYYQFFSKRY